MPKFTKLNPAEVHVGRGRTAFEARKNFVDAVKSGDAGRIDLDRGDKPATVKRLLQEAAKEAGVKVRSTWTDPSQKTLIWKKTRASRR
jgi:hypothetical protein